MFFFLIAKHIITNIVLTPLTILTLLTIQQNTIFKSTTYTIYHANLTSQGHAYTEKECNNLHYHQFLLVYLLFFIIITYKYNVSNYSITITYKTTHKLLFIFICIFICIFLVHVSSPCVRSAQVSYSIIERNDSGSFQIENSTGVFKLRSYAPLNSTFQFLVEARLHNDEHLVNSSTTLVLIQVISRDTLNARTIVNFETEKLGFLQNKRISNLAQQFGFFVNGGPDREGSLRAFVGEVSADMNYTTSREQAMHVKAVLISSDVYWDRPVVRVIAQVQDQSYNVRTLVEDSEVVVKVEPSANLSMIDGSILQVSKPRVFVEYVSLLYG